MTKNNTLQLWVPLALYIGVFLFKALTNPSELAFTAIAVVAIILTVALHYNEGELGLFLLGVLLGMFIEIGLVGVAGERQQIWLDASFFGIPYWLPLAWGLAFVVLPRIGMYVRESKLLHV